MAGVLTTKLRLLPRLRILAAKSPQLCTVPYCYSAMAKSDSNETLILDFHHGNLPCTPCKIPKIRTLMKVLSLSLSHTHTHTHKHTHTHTDNVTNQIFLIKYLRTLTSTCKGAMNFTQTQRYKPRVCTCGSPRQEVW